jgi:hypothetical protein
MQLHAVNNNISDILTEVGFAYLSDRKIQEINKYIACLQENTIAQRSSIRVIHINTQS